MAFTDLAAAADRTVLEHLGEPVVYRPAVGDPVPVTGIFDAPSALVQGGGQLAVEARAPTVFLILVDLPTNPEVDTPTLTIGGVDYEVIDTHPDGLGGIVLDLRKVT